MDVRIYLLAAAVFLAGVAENICVGILPAIAAGLHVSIAAAGQLTTIFSAVRAGRARRGGLRRAYRAAHRTARVARRVRGREPCAAASPGYASLFAASRADGRELRDADPRRDAVRGRAAPASQRGRAIGIVFMGISASLVLGVPIGMRIADWAGWRAVFVSIAVPALLLAIWLGRRLPRMAPSAVIAAADAAGTPSYRAVLAHPRLMAAQLVSIAMIGGHFTLFAYLTPYLQAVLSPGAAALEGLYVARDRRRDRRMAGRTLRTGSARRARGHARPCFVAMAVLPAASVRRVRTREGRHQLVDLADRAELPDPHRAVTGRCKRRHQRVGHACVALGSALGGVLVERDALRVTPWAGCGRGRGAYRGMARAAGRERTVNA